MSATEKINGTLESTWFHELAKKISEQFCIYHIIAINRNAFQNGRSNAKRQSSMNLALIRVQIERFLVHPFSLSDINEEKSTYINKHIMYKSIFWERVTSPLCVRAKSLQLYLTLGYPMDSDPTRLPLSMGFYRQEYWSGLPCLSPGDLPDPGIEPMSHVSFTGRQVLFH